MMVSPRGRRLRACFQQLRSVFSSWLLLFFLHSLSAQGQTCNDLSLVSLDADCTVPLTPDMVLEGTYADSLYTVQLTTRTGQPLAPVLTAAFLGDTLRATVTDTTTGNSCWGLLVVQDHWAPALICADITLPCAVSQVSPAFLANTLGLPAAFPTVTENCGPYTRSYLDAWTDMPCGAPGDYSAVLQRTWTVQDASGNTASCTQAIYLRRAHADAVHFPADTVLSCAQPSTAPASAGRPFLLEGGKVFPLYPEQGHCVLQVYFEDQIVPVCEGAYNILRRWLVFDDCLPAGDTLNPVQYNQIIHVVDNQGPVFLNCPTDTVVYTDPFTCRATLDLPDVLLRDNCSRLSSLYAGWEANGQANALSGALTDFQGNNWWDPDTLGVFGNAAGLAPGIVLFTYTAEDHCGQRNTCAFQVQVSDGVPPFVACDALTQVALGGTGLSLVPAATFDDGSWDNCAPLHFKARHLIPNACQPNDLFHDAVRFCCADAGDTISVVLRAYDVPVDTGSVGLDVAEGHASDCVVQVLVEDKQKPLCAPPPPAVVECKAFDPSLKAHGMAQFTDNCCLDSVWEQAPNYTLFDTVCNRGTIVRTFRALDCQGLSSQCTQRLIVLYDQSFSVKFPDDVVAFDCDTTGIYGPSPEVYDQDCELIAISYHDEVTTGGVQSCYRIERRWQVIDWCSYNPNYPMIVVPNPNPSSDPLDDQNLPGPVVAPLGHFPPPTQIRLTPKDPNPTDFSQFWMANTNGYVYKQSITVYDNVPPKTRGCPKPTGPVEFCDQSDNDPLFWNAPAWQNPYIKNSHDLCEGTTDLAVTASDGCSKGNVNIRYLLFLDLDGDGNTETVINSINPPPANTLYFGNANSPNFIGGEARPFDQRPVPLEEKYRFSIQFGGFVNKTAYVRWVTAKNPTQYVIPQLPHGLHRIMWIIEDGCGNETICEYTFLVKDCRNPDLACLNGLSVNIMPTKMITLWANDFVHYTHDNCTPVDQLKIGIRKKGAGTGFPYNPDGTPQASLTFTCDELGQQPVELWALDAEGNFNTCATYVLVQDNFSVCPSPPGTVAGTLRTEKNVGLEDAMVQLTGAQSGQHLDLTDSTGQFRFPGNGITAGPYALTPLKDNDPLNGVSTYDLVLINKHILGLAPLSSPYKMIAADANNSRSITTFDIVELRKLILGIYTELPANTSWRFVDKDYAFPNLSNPFQEIFPETRQLTDLQTPAALAQDFVAVKVGDVSGNALANAFAPASERSEGTLWLEVNRAPALSKREGDTDAPPDDDKVAAGEMFTLVFQAAEPVTACQFTLEFPEMELLDLVPGPGLSSANFAVFPPEHALTAALDNDAVRAAFTARFRAQADGRLSRMLALTDRITQRNAVLDADGEGVALALRFGNAADAPTNDDTAFKMYPNWPNPWHDHTRVRFCLPEPGAVFLNIYDETARLVFRQERYFQQGLQEWRLDERAVRLPGVYAFRLETATGNAVAKMVRW